MEQQHEDMYVEMAYARVSTKSQSLERQKASIYEAITDLKAMYYFEDKYTGKAFDRPDYIRMKEKITELAKKDAENNVYMGNEFMNLRKAEVAKVAPNRAALIGKFNQSISSGNMGDMKKIQEADKRWLCILFGIPYEAEYQGEGTGSALHIYNEEGEEVLTYTQGVGWHEKETKAETGVHSALKLAYYEAYHDARKALNTGTNVEITNENVVVQSNFDMKA